MEGVVSSGLCPQSLGVDPVGHLCWPESMGLGQVVRWGGRWTDEFELFTQVVVLSAPLHDPSTVTVNTWVFGFLFSYLKRWPEI